ncbi:hypothetical protein GGD81_003102 [Rhodobium orientis]|nr:DUF2059 domain-containing protein [Rhodobium orientis]MBB4304047.1 hypothetical protein [Rhodobium orientis]
MTLSKTVGTAALALAVMLVAGALNLTPAAAQEETFTPEHMKAAEAAVEATRSNYGFDEILPIVASQTKQQLVRQNPEFAREIDAMVNDVALSMAGKRVDLDKMIEEIWARRFTKEELDEITAFYTSPVGAKLAEKSAELSTLSIGAAREYRNQLGIDMLEQAQKEMEKIAAAAPEKKAE